jgi:hypothetical protein
LAAENWKERRPKEVFALGMTSEIYLLEHLLQVGVAMVTSELRRRGFTKKRLTDDLEPAGLRRVCSEAQPTRAYRSQWWVVYGALVTKRMAL